MADRYYFINLILVDLTTSFIKTIFVTRMPRIVTGSGGSALQGCSHLRTEHRGLRLQKSLVLWILAPQDEAVLFAIIFLRSVRTQSPTAISIILLAASQSFTELRSVCILSNRDCFMTF